MTPERKARLAALHECLTISERVQNAYMAQGGAKYARAVDYVTDEIRALIKQRPKKELNSMTIYLRHESTTDPLKRSSAEREKTDYPSRVVRPWLRCDVVYYKDREATQQLARNPWSDAPTKQNRWVTFNCQRYAVEWLPELEIPA